MKNKLTIVFEDICSGFIDFYRRLTMERVWFYETDGYQVRNYDTWVPRRLWDGQEFQNGVITAMECAGLHLGWKDEGRD